MGSAIFRLTFSVFRPVTLRINLYIIIIRRRRLIKAFRLPQSAHRTQTVCPYLSYTETRRSILYEYPGTCSAFKFEVDMHVFKLIGFVDTH